MINKKATAFDGSFVELSSGTDGEAAIRTLCGGEWLDYEQRLRSLYQTREYYW